MISLLGKDIEITACSNSTNVGLKGQVIGETKYSLVIKNKQHEKRVMKHTITFIVEGKTILGTSIVQKPQDRYKLKWKQK